MKEIKELQVVEGIYEEKEEKEREKTNENKVLQNKPGLRWGRSEGIKKEDCSDFKGLKGKGEEKGI